MSVEENKAAVRRVIEEAYNKGDLAVADEIIASNYVYHSPMGEFKGPEGFKQGVSMIRKAFPDLRITIEDIRPISEVNGVSVHFTMAGTFKGDLIGIPPTGQKLTIPGIVISHFAGDKEVEVWWSYSDMRAFYQQLGIEHVSQQLEVASRLRQAFPASLSAKVNSVLMFVPVSGIPPTQDDIGPIIIHGEELHIPYRIYSPEAKRINDKNLDNTQKIILACLYTRHHNGYVREKYLKYLFDSRHEWISPFVLQLLAEYVVEIAQEIEINSSSLDKEAYSFFAVENPQFVGLCQQRIISYWHCYNRSQVPFEEYPSYRVFQSLGLWTGRDGRRLLHRPRKIQ